MLTQSPSWWCSLVQPRWMPERRVLGGGPTCGVYFWPSPNSSGCWWLVSSVFLTRTSCQKTTHANGYYGAWPGWVVSISVLPLTLLWRSLSESHTQWGLLMRWKRSAADTREISAFLSRGIVEAALGWVQYCVWDVGCLIYWNPRHIWGCASRRHDLFKLFLADK